LKKEITIEITDLAYNGKAVGFDGGKVTFLNAGLPGETVQATVIKSRARYNEARVVDIVDRCPERIAPACRHFDICGGCVWQDLRYDRQLFFKRKQVLDCLEHIGKFDSPPVMDIIPAPEQFFYRNKMEFSFCEQPEPGSNHAPLRLGLHERGHWDRIFDIDYCHLQSELSNDIVRFVRSTASELGIPGYDIVNHKGFLRFLLIREGKQTDQIMVVLVTADGEFPRKTEFVERLRTQFPQITTSVWIINDKRAQIARGEIREVLFGQGYIEERILDRQFEIRPASFFQTNSGQTETLYRKALAYAQLTGAERVLDLYCGAGTIGICVAAKASEVIGIELEPEAVEAARRNAERNNLTNCRFHAGHVKEFLKTAELRDKPIDTVFIDPPRSGLHPKGVKRLLELGIPRLVYISCNPSTFARDAALFGRGGYLLNEITPVDMFPHTMHIELVSLFEMSQ
jgi:23S rRNA (uracil1939-C5)-methyltransferase